MKSALVVVAFVATFFVAVPVAHMLRDAFGPAAMSMLTLAFAFTAAWLGHTPRSQAMAADLRGALADIGMSQKEASILAGVPEPTMANWLSGKEQASLWRLAELGPDFDVAFAKRRIARSGQAQVLDSRVICELIDAVQCLTAERRRPVLVPNVIRSEVA